VSNRSKATCLFDDRVGAGEQGRRNIEVEGLCGFQVENEFKPSGLLNREIAGLFALQNAIDIAGRLRTISGTLGPYDMSPPSLTNSRQPYIVGRPRRAACSMIRARFKTANPWVNTITASTRSRTAAWKTPSLSRPVSGTI
jgi:hypothetical protein